MVSTRKQTREGEGQHPEEARQGEILNDLSTPVSHLHGIVASKQIDKVKLPIPWKDPDNPLALRGGWAHPYAWTKGSPAIERSPLAPLLIGLEGPVIYKEDPFPDRYDETHDRSPLKDPQCRKEFHNLTKLYAIEAMSLARVDYCDRCEIAGVAEDYEVTVAKYSTPSGVLPPRWVVEMGELIWLSAAKKWQGLMAAHLRSEAIETRKRIIAIKHDLKEKFPEEHRVICHEAWEKGNMAALKIKGQVPPPLPHLYLKNNGLSMWEYICEHVDGSITPEEEEMVEACMNNDLATDGTVLKRNRKTQTENMENSDQPTNLEDTTSLNEDTTSVISTEAQPQAAPVLLPPPSQEAEDMETNNTEECTGETPDPPPGIQDPIQEEETNPETQEEEGPPTALGEDMEATASSHPPSPHTQEVLPPQHTKRYPSPLGKLNECSEMLVKVVNSLDRLEKAFREVKEKSKEPPPPPAPSQAPAPSLRHGAQGSPHPNTWQGLQAMARTKKKERTNQRKDMQTRTSTRGNEEDTIGNTQIERPRRTRNRTRAQRTRGPPSQQQEQDFHGDQLLRRNNGQVFQEYFPPPRPQRERFRQRGTPPAPKEQGSHGHHNTPWQRDIHRTQQEPQWRRQHPPPQRKPNRWVNNTWNVERQYPTPRRPQWNWHQETTRAQWHPRRNQAQWHPRRNQAQWHPRTQRNWHPRTQRNWRPRNPHRQWQTPGQENTQWVQGTAEERQWPDETREHWGWN